MNLGWFLKLGISTSYIQTAQASAVAWCVAWLVKERVSAANHSALHEHAVRFAMGTTGWPGLGRSTLQTITFCRKPKTPQCLLVAAAVNLERPKDGPGSMLGQVRTSASVCSISLEAASGQWVPRIPPRFSWQHPKLRCRYDAKLFDPPSMLVSACQNAASP